MTAPTPVGPSVHGPWIEHAEVPHTVYGSDGYQVCRLMRGNRPSSETEAIRRLIVSAPALQAENARLRALLERSSNLLFEIEMDYECACDVPHEPKGSCDICRASELAQETSNVLHA